MWCINLEFILYKLLIRIDIFQIKLLNDTQCEEKSAAAANGNLFENVKVFWWRNQMISECNWFKSLVFLLRFIFLVFNNLIFLFPPKIELHDWAHFPLKGWQYSSIISLLNNDISIIRLVFRWNYKNSSKYKGISIKVEIRSNW